MGSNGKLAQIGPIYQKDILLENPLAMAASLAYLTEIAKPNIHKHLAELTTRLVKNLQKQKQVGIPFIVNHVSKMLYLFFTKSKQVKYYIKVFLYHLLPLKPASYPLS